MGFREKQTVIDDYPKCLSTLRSSSILAPRIYEGGEINVNNLSVGNAGDGIPYG